MPARSDIIPSALAFVIGAADWELVRTLGTRRDAWDDPLDWQLGYPLLLVAAFGLGFVWRERALALGRLAYRRPSHVVAVPGAEPGRHSQSSALGFVMFALLGIPLVLAAYAGRWLGERALT
ncbi:MAG TPA: hypothetical protein VFR71_06325 [Methyloceanibacter sp.]|nr:hypothetical protein [Methyloceanibacter sp.]